MGGCRCTFRNCENSTQNNPAMHFFHFPFRDFPRCEKWAEYSNNLAFLQLPINQLRNKVVCETHFRETCFMNIKHERLTKFAIPTLLITKNGEIVDFEIDLANPTIYDVQTTKTSKYYEPPSKPKLLNNIVQAATLQEEEDESVTETLVDRAFDYSEIEHCQDDINDIISSQRVIESETPEPTLLNGITLTKIEIDRYDPECESEIKPPLTKLKRKIHSIVKSKLRNDRIISKDSSTKLEDYDDDDDDDDEDDDVEFYDYPKRTKIVEPSPSSDITIINKKMHASSVNKTVLLETVENQTREIHDLKKIIAEKMNNLEELHRQTIARSPPPPVVISADEKPRNFIEAGPTKTKIQLFNGIKKYLNPSMVALLRMEMFGDTERQYKSDEKSLAVELLNVQSNIYEYMRSELRFRLPPKKDAECWAKEMSENGREIDWEDEF